MRKRILCILLLLVTLSLMLFGCTEKQENPDKLAITDGVFKVGVLLPAEVVASKDVEAGLSYAYSLASSVKLNESVDVKLTTEYFDNSSDVTHFAERLVADGVSAIVFYSEDLDSFNAFVEYIGKTEVFVISLSPFTADYDNIYTLSLSPKYLSSCAATYAMEKGYGNCAVLLSGSEKFYTDFAETYKNTLSSYIGSTPTVYYKSGELTNYSSSALASGNYEYLFFVSSAKDREETVTELRTSGFMGEIMLTEVMNTASLKRDIFNNCSFVNKLEADSSNNVSTVFYSMFSEYSGVKETDVSPASAYGYDAYMTIFEALKSFAPKGSNSVFLSSAETNLSTEATIETIKMSDLRNAVGNVAFFGVTDTIEFSDNAVTTTYIYVDNVLNADILFNSKYTFSADSRNVK